MSKALITGNSSGIGQALTRHLLDQGWQVYGLSRRGAGFDHPGLHDRRCDLADLAALPAALEALLGQAGRLDLVVLNAGLLGEIKDMTATSLDELNRLMDVNVWANKLILDWLIAHAPTPAQVVLISSGAAVNGNKGWGAYSLSKAALNMLARLYAHEMPDSHLCALAPGLVDTAMQDYLCDPAQVDVDRYASVQKLRSARGTDAMPTPGQAAARILEVLARLRQEPSGGFVDLRNLG